MGVEDSSLGLKIRPGWNGVVGVVAQRNGHGDEYKMKKQQKVWTNKESIGWGE